MIEVIKAGMYTTVQDIGRETYSDIGVPKGGAMDQKAFLTANALLGNNPNDACLEITMMGPELKFDSDTYIAIAGAEFEIYLDDKPQPHLQPIAVKANQTLTYKRLKSGFRSYLAISGGIQTPVVLGSRSFLKNVTPHIRLENGMELPYSKNYKTSEVYAIPKIKVFDGTLKVYHGPEYHQLSIEQQEQLHQTEFEVSHLNDRMAYQLQPTIEEHQISQITVPVLPGSIQLTPNGSLIILMRDGQTTGGYPRVLQLSEHSINQLAQMATASSFKFKFLTKFKDSL